MCSDLSVDTQEHVSVVEIRRAPNNFFDLQLIEALADAYQSLDDDPACRAIVLCSQGKHFCAGANFNATDTDDTPRDDRIRSLYREAVRLFRSETPVVAAVHGAAIGGGLGLALSADFRVTCAQARFSANFARLGFYQGFGLSVTLPRLVGPSQADLMLFTGRRVKGDEAVAIGLADELAPVDQVRERAHALAREIAGSAPLAVRSIRKTRRQGLADRVASATNHELREQNRLRQTEDFQEGVKAMTERRTPDFKGR